MARFFLSGSDVLGWLYAGETVTTDTTAAPVATVPIPDEGAFDVNVKLIALDEVNDHRASYDLVFRVRKNAGVATPTTTGQPAVHEQDSTWNVSYQTPLGPDLVITAAGGTGDVVRWRCWYIVFELPEAPP